MTLRIKHILVGTGILAGLILLFASASVFYLKTDHAQRLVQAKVSASIPGAISWKRLRFSLLKGEFELENFLLKGPSNDDLAGFDRLFVDLSCTTLFRGDLTVTAFTLEKPWATLHVDSEGQINLMQAFPASKTEKTRVEEDKWEGVPINIVLKSLKVTQGFVRYQMVAGDLKAEAQEVDLAADGNLLEQSGNLTFQIGKGSVDSPKIRTELDQFKLEATLSKGRIEPLVLRMGTDSSKLLLSGNISDVLAKPFLNIALDLSVFLPELRNSLHIEPSLTGQVAAHLTAQGTPDNPEVTLHLDYGGGSLAGNRIDQIDMNCHLKDRLLTLKNLRMDAASGDLNVQGEVDLRDAFSNGFLSPKRDLETISYKILLQEKGIRLEQLRERSNESRGTVSSNLSLYGKGISPQTLTARVAMEVFVEQLTTNQVAAPVDFQFKTEAHIDQGVATLEHLEAEGRDIKLKADGRLDLSSKDMTARFTLDAPSLDATLSSFGIGDVHGECSLKATASGSIERPVFDFALNGDQLRFREITLGKVRLNAGLDPSGTLRIPELLIHNQNSQLRVSGTAQILERDAMHFLKEPRFEVALEADTIFMEDFTTKLKGKLSVAANVGGAFTEPRGTVNLHGENLDVGVQKFAEVKLSSRLDGEKIWIDPLQIVVAPGELIEAAGWFSLQKAYAISLVSDGVSLQHIDKVREENIADGKLVFDISGKGTLEAPQISGNIALKGPEIKGNRLDDFYLHLDLDHESARISGKLNFDISGSFHLQKKDFSVSVLFDETDLSPYLKIAGQPDLNGTLTGQVEANGNAGTIGQLEAFLDFSKLYLFYKEKELIHAQDFKVSVQEEEISIHGLHLLLLKEGKLDIKGKGKRNGPLAFRLEGTVPVRLASLFVEGLADGTGDLLVSATIGGTHPQPDIQAEIALDRVGFTVPVLLQKVHGLHGRIQVNPHAITIDRIEGQLDTGRFDLAGNIDLEAFQPSKVLMNLNAHALPLQVPDTLDAVLNTKLKIHGTREKSMIQGEAVIVEGTYYKDVNLSLLDAVGQKKREEAPPPREITQPFLKNMSLDISISRRNPFLVDNNLAQLEISPDLRLTGKLNNPIVSGRAEIDSGTISFQKKTFVVKKGVVDFLNPYKIEPTLDIESEVRIRTWTIFLEITGTPDRLTFKLTSEPPEEEGDILSLLLFGRTTHELIEGAGGTSQSTAQMVAELVSMTFGEDIKEATGLDILEIETQEPGDEEASDRVKVTIGKELSKRMTVKYAVESKAAEMVQSTIAEYKLLETILLSGFQDSRGIFGGELQFRLEFR
jgi:translocation and assembly module TamB